MMMAKGFLLISKKECANANFEKFLVSVKFVPKISVASFLCARN